MKRNCNLELRLFTPSVSDHPSTLDMEDWSGSKRQQLTIFYQGKIASCDATELQARAIISLAGGEMEDKSRAAMKRSVHRFLEERKNRAHSTSPYPIIKH